MESVSKIKVLSWNVRGLNEKDKRLAVRQTVLLEKPDVICFQETKMSVMNNSVIQQACGRRLKDSEYKGADGTKGGILFAWNETKFKKIDCIKGRFSLSVTFKYNGDQFKMTGVYGPTSASQRSDFF